MFPSDKVDHEVGSKLDFDNLYVGFSRDMIKYTTDSCASESRKLNDKKAHVDKTLSTDARIRLAGQLFVESYSSKFDEIYDLAHPFSESASGLSDDEAKDIKLLITLLASVEKTDQQKFNQASKLIKICNNMSSDEGNPIERLVHYFSEAIREKINRETEKVACCKFESMHVIDLHEAMVKVDKRVLSFHQKLPLSQIYQFGTIQSIVVNLRGFRKVHVIDFEIRSGMKYMIMLRTFANQESHVEKLKITAVGTRAELKIKDAGMRLAEFAKSINVPFSFKIVMVADILDFNTNLLELDKDEKVAVCAPFFLSTLISKPKSLEHLMRVIRKINPCITVITEIEANHTTPAFANRFTEALFFYGTIFDSSSCCSENDERYRKITESVFFGQTIRNIVAADGNERTIRHIGVDVWRTFLARFGMVENKVSDELVFEANLLISSFDRGDDCSIRVDGGGRFELMVVVCLLIGKMYQFFVFLLGNLYNVLPLSHIYCHQTKNTQFKELS